ncbi:MAG: META domain-containing protein [Ignavibacteriaceae bacterium]|nr:META domain-containing protein [Ignavibacteriaceae bacterium]
MYKILIVITLTILFAGCFSQSVIKEETVLLSNNLWTLSSLPGIEVLDSQSEKAPNISFNLNENKVSGFAGCNRFMGPVQINGETIKFGNIASTMMACPEMELEIKFMKIFNTVDRYTIQDGKLIFFSGDNVVAKFNKGKASEGIK